MMPANWTQQETSAANTSKTASQPAHSPTTKHVVTLVDVFVRAASPASDMVVELRSGTTVKWKGVIGTSSGVGTHIGFALASGIQMGAGEAVNLVVPAGGASVVSELTVGGYTL